MTRVGVLTTSTSERVSVTGPHGSSGEGFVEGDEELVDVPADEPADVAGRARSCRAGVGGGFHP